MSDRPGSPPPLPVLARPVELRYAPAARPVNPLLMRDLTLREAALDGALVLIVAVAAQFLPGLVLAFFMPDTDVPQFDFLIVWSKVAELSAVLTIAAYFVLRSGVRPQSFGLRSDGVGVQIAWGLLTLISIYAVVIVSGILLVMLSFWFGGGPGDDIEKRMEFASALTGLNVFTTMMLSLIVACHEELLFRGLLLPYLRRTTGSWFLAIAITSLIFGSLHFHQGTMAIFQLTLTAVVLCTFFVLTRSLLAVIVAHFLFDFIQMQIMSHLPQFEEAVRQLPS